VLVLLADDVARVGAAITVDVPDGLDALGDRLQIEQVLLNLVRNSLEALAEAPRGARAIRISAGRDPEGRVEIAIADTGSGIAPHVLERLFEPFVTANASGMGLGLTISRSIVQAHGGKLWAESRPSEGTVMRFTLPAADAAVSSEMDRAHG
jgi:signal transduction histidine kinase